MKDFLKEVENLSFDPSRFKSVENLRGFLDWNVTLFDFLKDKSIIDFEKNDVKDFGFNFSSINDTSFSSSVTFMNCWKKGDLILKDLYQIKEEYKKYVDLLIKYLKENKLAFRRIVWLEYHGLNDYFDIGIEKK